MGTGNQWDLNFDAFGPFGPLFQTYVSALENVGRAYGIANPLAPDFNSQSLSQRMSGPLKAAARCQLEVLGLVNRRAQAYMHVPTRLAQCRTPQDLLNEQMGFWRTAAEQYAESSRRIFDAWAVADPGYFSGGRKAAERDYINFNGTGSKEGGVHATRQEQPAGKQRRVA